MSEVEAYLFLFVDSIFASMILVPNTFMAYNAMAIFGTYSKLVVMVVAILGNIIGLSFNYLLGMILNTVKKSKLGNSEKYVRLAEYTQKKLFFLSILSFIPIIGVVITTFLGMMRVKYYKFLFYAIIGMLLYYGVIA